MRRGTFDIMTDILRVATIPCSEAEILSSANLSFAQFRRYKSILEGFGYLYEVVADGKHIEYWLTSKGKEYLDSVSSEFGRIPDGERSVWVRQSRL